YLWSVVVVWYSGRLRGRWECLGVSVLSLAGLVVFVMLLSLVGLLDTLVRPRVAIGMYALFASASILVALVALYRPVQPDRFLAGGLGGLMAISLELSIDETLRLLLALLIVTAFYALVTWRLLAERERSLDRLRPFVASRQLSASLLDPGGAGREGGVASRTAA